MFFTTHLAPNIMIGSTISSCVTLNPNILPEKIALMYLQYSGVVRKHFECFKLQDKRHFAQGQTRN